MPESLRERLIEAGMEAFATTEAKWEPPDYGIDELAEACLDAFLDTLADNADEWIKAADQFQKDADRVQFALPLQHKALLAVLRGDDNV